MVQLWSTSLTCLWNPHWAQGHWKVTFLLWMLKQGCNML